MISTNRAIAWVVDDTESARESIAALPGSADIAPAGTVMANFR